MSYYDDDRWDFNLEGEGRIEPDPTDSTAIDDGSYERGEDSLEDDHMGYPDKPGPDSYGGDERAEHHCECGVPLDPGRSKCDFCLTNDLDYDDTPDKSDTNREVTGLIHVLVDATSEANAVCAAQTVFDGLTGDPPTSSVDGIDECELVATLEDDLVDRFAREWGQLPGATPVDSTAGQRQLDTIRQNAGHDYLVAKDNSTDTAADNRPTLDPVLFDADGEPITDIEAIGQLIAGGTLKRTRPEWDTSDSGDEPTRTWIVPAIALEHESVSDSTYDQSRDSLTHCFLECCECTEETRHRFDGFNAVPNPAWEDDPVWKCTRCGTARHGPVPSALTAKSHSQH
ncbi:hypothetical protein [Saliphagus infecundisoli]|uniref:DUF7995 domain-containing protein n=1 Tax=Saliphagus infecundisoli TaxID=1849069 RepID=A0ABD5QI61_9EURY|nr:hypothetical protein [Saliphagus infecundisoli]